MHSVNRTGLICLGLALAAAWSAPRKSPTGRAAASDRAPVRAPAETVYVQTAPAAAPASLFSSSSASARDADDRRTKAAFAAPAVTGPIRDYAQSYGLSTGFYNAELLGSNPYANIFWDLYPGEQPFFFEFTGGVGTLQSSFSKSVVGAGFFSHNLLLTTEALGGYSLSGLMHGMGRAGGLFPYFVTGITLIYQGGPPFMGGVPNIGGVIGFGNRMNLPYGPKDGRWALNYGLRDHIYSQKIRPDPSLTQNLILLVGVQKYY